MHDDYEGRLAMGTPANLNGDLKTVRVALYLQLSDCQHAVVARNAATEDLLIQSVDFAALNETLLDKFRPEVIVAPLFSEGFDIVDVAEALSFAGFFGELWAVGPDLPNPGLIEREIREFAGHIQFRIISDPRAAQMASGH